MSILPVYDDYHVMFDNCDKFNKCLCHCTWPHEIGERVCSAIAIVRILRVVISVLIALCLQTKNINLPPHLLVKVLTT